MILGGKDKGGDFTLLRDALKKHAKRALLIGAAAEKIAGQIAGSVPIETVGTIERAITRASEIAQPGDTVLLAPACASFDQFQNYEHRGRVFKQRVRQLQEEFAAEGRATASLKCSEDSKPIAGFLFRP